MTTSNAYLFTRTGRTWGVLLLAAIAWLIISLWAYRVAATQHELGSAGATEAPDGRATHVTLASAPGVATSSELNRENEQAAGREVAAKQIAEREAAEREAAEREAAEREAAESEAAEKKIAEEEASEREIAEREAAEREAAEREAAEREAAEKGAAQREIAQREAAQRDATEQARQAAQQNAEEQAQLIAQQEGQAASSQSAQLTEQQTALLAEQQAADEQAIAAEEAQRAATLASQHQVQLQAQNAAAEEARRVAADSRLLTAYEELRNEETSVLAGLSARLRFQNRSGVPDRQIERILDRVFEPLFLYEEMPVLIRVSTNELRDPADNNRLSRERARSLVSYLVSRGLQEDRFDIQTDSGEGLPYGSHRVRVSVEDPIQ